MKPVTLYKDKAGECRWKLIAKNGKIIDASTEGFKTKWGCLNNLHLVKEAMYSEIGEFGEGFMDEWLEDLT